MSNPWIDVSVPVHTSMVHWPGDPPFQIRRTADLERGDVCTVSQVSMGVHTGTHMDAPLHFVRGGAAMDALPLDAVLGRARVIEILAREAIDAETLRPCRLQAGERVLLKTRNSSEAWKRPDFVEDFVHISRDGAAYLAERRVRTVGIDYLSVGGYQRDGTETHLALLTAGIWLIEGLDLSAVGPGAYELMCLPLRLVGAEGAPARAVLRALPA